MSTTLKWFKSSYSSPDGDKCLEVAIDWQKSSYSGDDGDACVEVATGAHTVHVRDSKDTGGPVIGVGSTAWAGLTGWVRGTHR
ncbi:DUF397 domain-containing protein [Streptomyces sp. NPDC059564]|uniref:DUF397 domain-containing protein n=1 Tax=Streptomyces sp. NPDC059564 TaxID=3346865 RepID=UPI0036C4B4EA